MRTLVLVLLALCLVACSGSPAPSSTVASDVAALDPANENQEYNICTPPNHPAFRKNGVYRNDSTGLWYTHVIDQSSAPIAYRSSYTCTCAQWNPITGACMTNVPSQRPAHANDYSGCSDGPGGNPCRFYIGTDANHSGYVLVGPGMP